MPHAAARFSHIEGLAVAPCGRLLCTNNRRIRIIDRAGHVTTLAGTGKKGSDDGPFTRATFDVPNGVALVPGARALSDPDAAAAFIGWIVQLKTTLGVPAKLAAVGVKTEQIDALVEVAINDICHQTNPRPCTREDFARIFAGAI